MPASFDIIQKRQRQLTTALQQAGLDALALNPGPSLTYFTGLHFHLSERPVIGLFTPSASPVMILPELEAAKLDKLDYELNAFTYSENPDKWAAAFKQGVQAAGLSAGKVGVEDRRLRLLELRLLELTIPKARFINATDTLAQLRMHKDDGEVAAMQAAIKTAQQALEAALPLVKIGMMEKELANELVLQLLRHGSDGELPFQPIVSSGPNSANPHAFPGERKLSAGDLLVIDWGAKVDGYFSDITRTFGVGEVSAEQENIHKIVRQANRAARMAALPGMTCGQVDTAARQVIEAAGYGQFFIHRTGHGLGMEVHEEPYIRAGNLMTLAPGMTFTIEPGIYLPGQDGVRIEDNVLITVNGVRCLTNFPRELQIIG